MAVNAKKRLSVFRRDRFRCVVCGRNDDLTVDHILPISKGGTDEEKNLQTMCQRCNLRKGNHFTPPWWKKITLPFFSKHEAMVMENRLKEEISERQSSLHGVINQKFDDLIPRLKEMLAPFEVQKAGLTNNIEAYRKRGEEKDQHLMNILKLVVEKLEEHDNKINRW